MRRRVIRGSRIHVGAVRCFANTGGAGGYRSSGVLRSRSLQHSIQSSLCRNAVCKIDGIAAQLSPCLQRGRTVPDLHARVIKRSHPARITRLRCSRMLRAHALSCARMRSHVRARAVVRAQTRSVALIPHHVINQNL